MSSTSEYFTCLICQEVPDPALAIQCTGCRTVFCDRCVFAWSEKSKDCANCREQHDYVAADKAIKRVLGETKVECPYECGAVTTKSELHDHCRLCDKRDGRFDFTAVNEPRTPLLEAPQEVVRQRPARVTADAAGPSQEATPQQDQCESSGFATAAVVGAAVGGALVGILGGLIGAMVSNSVKKKDKK